MVQSTGASVCAVRGLGSYFDWMQSFYSVDSSSVNTNTTVFHRFISISFTHKQRTYSVWMVSDNIACMNTRNYVGNLPKIRKNSYVKAHVTNHGPARVRIDDWMNNSWERSWRGKLTNYTQHEWINELMPERSCRETPITCISVKIIETWVDAESQLLIGRKSSNFIR